MTNDPWAHWAHYAVISLRNDGTWGVYCIGCSEKANDYIYPCAINAWSEIPPLRLVDADK